MFVTNAAADVRLVSGGRDVDSAPLLSLVAADSADNGHRRLRVDRRSRFTQTSSCSSAVVPVLLPVVVGEQHRAAELRGRPAEPHQDAHRRTAGTEPDGRRRRRQTQRHLVEAFAVTSAAALGDRQFHGHRRQHAH